MRSFVCNRHMSEVTTLSIRPEDYSWPHIPVPSRFPIYTKSLLFQQISDLVPLNVALATSTEERKRGKETDSSLVYGEIDFTTLAEVIEIIKSRYGGLPPGHFYDLGSVLPT